MSTYLLDANVLIALVLAEHEHHDRAARWISDVETFALCPVVQGSLVRFLLRLGETAGTARSILGGVQAHPSCAWWPDDLSYAEVDLAGVRGHRQVTDVYLAGLAARHGGLLATLDQPLSALRPEQVVLIP